MSLIYDSNDSPISAQAINGRVDLHVATNVDELSPEEAELLASKLNAAAAVAREQLEADNGQKHPLTYYYAEPRPLGFDWITPFGREDRHCDRYFSFESLIESDLVDSFEQAWEVCVKLLSLQQRLSAQPPAEAMRDRGVLMIVGSRGDLASQMVRFLSDHPELEALLSGRYHERVFVDGVVRGA